MGHYDGMDELLAEESENRRKIVRKWTQDQYYKAKLMHLKSDYKRQIGNLQSSLKNVEIALKKRTKVKVDKKDAEIIGRHFHSDEYLHTYTKDYGHKK
jgi:hypothetical protein